MLAEAQLEFGNVDQAVNLSLAQVANGARIVVAGQQLGFFGGASLTVLKAITAVALAREVGAVPLFWIASEDHDVDEFATTYVLSSGGDLQRYRAQLTQGKAVETIPLSMAHITEYRRLFSDWNLPHRPLQEGSRYIDVAITELIRLFSGTGLLFIEPRHLRPYAHQFFADELDRAAEYNEILVKTAPALQLTPGATNLFFIDETGRRQKIMINQDRFTVAGQPVTKEELLADLSHLSTNVAARPLLQNSALSVAHQVAGPNESRYLNQLVSYAQAKGITMPPISHRHSVTFVPPSQQQWLDRLNLAPNQTDAITRENLAAAGLPTYAAHYLRNLIHPHNKPQERLINWSWLEKQMGHSLIPTVLKLHRDTHHYVGKETISDATVS